MKRGATAAILVAGLLSVVFSAGFFHSKAPGPFAKACESARAPCPPPAARVEFSMDAPGREDGYKSAGEAAGRPGLLAMTSAPSYRRAADFSLRVADCTQAEDDLESKLQSIKGEILEMLMEGTEGSRTCTLSVLIPSNEFRSFIAELRKMGKVQSERITASKLKPAEERSGPAAGEPDPKELSLVSIRMADEKIAPAVLESRGVLAASFNESASHFLKGLAVLVELLGYALPFVLAFAVIALPFAVALRLRRT